MNCFYLSDCPVTAARHHSLVHVNKMLQEYAQMSSTAHRLLDGQLTELTYTNYKGELVTGEWYLHPTDIITGNQVVKHHLCKHTHVNHPSSKWVRESSQHYYWMVTCGLELCRIWRKHKGVDHGYYQRYLYLGSAPVNLPDNGFTPPPFCGDEDLRDFPVIKAYQHLMRRKFIDWLTRDRVIEVCYSLPRPDWMSVYC